MKKELIVRDVNDFLKELNSLDFIKIDSVNLTGNKEYIIKSIKVSNFDLFFDFEKLFTLIKYSDSDDYVLKNFKYRLLKNLSLEEINKLFNILDLNLVEINIINKDKTLKDFIKN